MTFHSAKHGAERLKAEGASQLVVRSVAFGRSWRRSEVDTRFSGGVLAYLRYRGTTWRKTRRFHDDDDDIAARRSAWIPKNQSPWPIGVPDNEARLHDLDLHRAVGHAIEIIITRRSIITREGQKRTGIQRCRLPAEYSRGNWSISDCCRSIIAPCAPIDAAILPQEFVREQWPSLRSR